MPASHRTVAALGILMLAIVGCTPQSPGADRDDAVSLTPTDRATAATTPPSPPPPPEADPFDLVVSDIGIRSMDNAEILGIAGAPVDEAVVREAVEAARLVLLGYLDAQFVDPSTRFSSDPLELLLGEAAFAGLTHETRSGLGDVLLPLSHTATGPASAVADVLISGDTVHAVTLTYQAELTVALTDGTTGPVVQRGSMLFTQAGGALRAQAVEVTLDLPGTAERAP